MFQFIHYIFTDIHASIAWKILYLLEKIIKYPIVLSNRFLKTNLKYPYIIQKDYMIHNSDGKFLIQAKSGNDYIISTYQETDFRSFFLNIQEWKIFLDIGSHIGKWSILLANKKNIRAYCFEPNPNTYKYLQENIILNQLEGKITALNYWVAEQKWEMEFYIHPQSAMSSLIENREDRSTKSEDTIRVKIIDIDTFIQENNINIQDIDLIKIDVEWYESNVIDGMKDLLENCSKDLKIICEITSDEKESIKNTIRSYWFKVQSIGNQDFYFYKT